MVMSVLSRSMTARYTLDAGLKIQTERQRMILGWVFAGGFFLLAFVSSFVFGSPTGHVLAPGVVIMVVVSSLLVVLSIYIYYVSDPEEES
jgi:hypothetical protein